VYSSAARDSNSNATNGPSRVIHASWPGLDYAGISGLEVGLGAVVVRDVHRPGLDDAHMPSLAARGANHRLMHSDHRQPGSNAKRPTVVFPTLTRSTCVLAGVRVSPGESKSSL
jgi:hypothetical protein